MSAVADGNAHVDASQKHLEHAEFLKTSGRADAVTVGWAITALFYSAVHAVRAYLKACKGIDITSHDDLKGRLRRQELPELQRTAPEYRLLEQESHSARYYCNPNFTWADFEQLRKKADKISNTWIPKAQECLSRPSSAKT